MYQKVCQYLLPQFGLMLILILIMYIDYRQYIAACPSWGARLERSTGNNWLPGSKLWSASRDHINEAGCGRQLDSQLCFVGLPRL